MVNGSNASAGGGTVVVNSSAMTAVGTIVDSHGIQWTVKGSYDSTGANVVLAVSTSVGGASTISIPYNVLSSGTLGSASLGGLRPDGGGGAGRLAVEAGAVAATMTMVAAICFFVPGGQVASGVAGLCAAAAGVVAAGAAIVDYNEQKNMK
jgi:hypothetical protein